MRELKEGEKNLIAALTGTAKSAVSIVPGIGQVIAGYDAYRQRVHDRGVEELLKQLVGKVDDITVLFSDAYFQTEDGQGFARKVVDAALDAQLEDKQELFANVLVNAPGSSSATELEKLKFVDMLRQMSRASLMVLAEMHKMFASQVRGPGRNPTPSQAFPLVDPDKIAEQLSDRYDPYLVTASISEMQSQGLFSTTGEWRKANGRYVAGGGYATALCYTDFAARFVEFITTETGDFGVG